VAENDGPDKPALNRRDLLKVAGYTAAALAGPAIITNLGSKTMAKSVNEHYDTDIIVVGSGFAGMFAALEASEEGVNVLMIDKGTVGCSGMSPWASDSRPFRKSVDSRDEWMENVSFATEFLNDRRWLDMFIDQSMGIWEELISWGVGKTKPFERARIFSDKLDQAGVTVVERVMVYSLLQDSEKRVCGVLGFTYDDSREECKAVVVNGKAVILCTGAGSYKSPGFPIWGLTFDGDAMAYRAGAYITGKEFHDTHAAWSKYPAASYDGWEWAQDVTGSIVMEGATNKSGRGGLTLDLALRASTGDITRELLGPGGERLGGRGGGGRGRGRGRPSDAPPRPSRDLGYRVGGSTAGMGVHKGEGVFCSDYTCKADGVIGLYAAGDALGSMMCGTVYPGRGFSSYGSAIQGRRATGFAIEYVKEAALPKVSEDFLQEQKALMWAPRERKQGFSPRWATQVLQNTMTPYFTLYIKEKRRLEGALAAIEYLRKNCVAKMVAADGHELRLAHEVDNMLLNAEMKLRAGLFRTESRGTHFREDYPARNDKEWLAWIKIRKEDNSMVLSKHPIPEEWKPDANLSYRERYPKELPGEDEFLEANPHIL
jgi:succinate dehydrogenase/fumarate reductase flavoprotein subunit